MSTPYAPTPGINETQNVYQIFNWVSETATKGVFWVAIIWTVWVIAIIGNLSEGKNFTRSLIFANFICLILGSILTLLGWISQTWTWFFVILLGISIFWDKISD